MSKFIIKNIYLKNFKSVEEATIEFEGMNLNVLDGPNGFGKTTLYDALQLILTGKIRRIETNKIVTTNRGFNEPLLSKDQSQPTIIKVEFINKDDLENSVVIARKFVADGLTNSQKRPNDFSNYHLFLLNSFEDQDYHERISNQRLSELLNVPDIEERYNLYHYIEQEDSGFLFKQNEKDRMDLISKLFNIEIEVNQKKYFDRSRKKLINVRTKLNGKIRSLEHELQSEDAAPFNQLAYSPLVKEDAVLNVSWDQVDIKPLDIKLKTEYFKELDIINNLINNFSDFKKELKNIEIDNVLNSGNRLKAIIVFSNFHKEYKNIEDEFNQQKKLLQILNILKNQEIIEKTIDWDYLIEKLNVQINQEVIIHKIKTIKTVQQSSNNLSQLLNMMNMTRDKLLKDFEQLISLNSNYDNQCPLCGDTKKSFDELSEQITQKTITLTEAYDESTQMVNSEINSLYHEYLNSLIELLEKEIYESSRIDAAFIEQLRTFKDIITNMEVAIEWFKALGVDIDKYINKDLSFVENLEEKVENLKKETYSKKLTVNDTCKGQMSDFIRVYQERLSKNDDWIREITEISINNKKAYIEYQLLVQTSLTYQKVQNYKVQYSKILHSIDTLGRIISIYNEKINKYRAKMINDIEIPFYIYSGKIIQNHQRGIGVFIKEDKIVNQESGEVQLKSINFLPPEKTDHDIIHSFSSGQLSSTVIAFTLALNKVYGNEGIMSLLIDDPVQTMDEMNMASFVELLRNDFTNRQIILSTHEENISLYMRYKFLKYGLSVGNINVKEKLYNS